MVGAVGAGTTMKLGGGITELMTLLFAWRIPALMAYPRSAARRGTATAAAGNGRPDQACDQAARRNEACELDQGEQLPD